MKHEERRIINHTPGNLYNLVADVRKYPEFLQSRSRAPATEPSPGVCGDDRSAQKPYPWDQTQNRAKSHGKE